MRILLGDMPEKGCPLVPHENDEGFQLQTFFVYFYCDFRIFMNVRPQTTVLGTIPSR